MTNRIMAHGLIAVAAFGVALAGCDTSKSSKSIRQASRHIINQVGIRTALNATGSDFVPHDGVDGALAQIFINVDGDGFQDFGNPGNIVVALAEINAGDFDATVAGVRTGSTAFPFSILPVSHTVVDQHLITFPMPTTSPLLSVTGDVRVVVLILDAPNDVDTVGNPPRNLDVLHLTTTAQTGGQGVTVSLGTSGDGAGAFDVGYPGSSGILMAATIANNTGETVRLNDITSGNRNIAFGVAVHNFLIDDVFPMNLANGDSRTIRFVAAITEDALLAGMTGQMVIDTTGQGNPATGIPSGIARVVSATTSFTNVAAPTIQAIGGSTRSHTPGGANDAGNGGNVIISADGSVAIGGTAIAVPAPGAVPFNATPIGMADVVLTNDDLAAGATDFATTDWQLDGTGAVGGRINVSITGGGGNGVLEIDADGDVNLRNVTFSVNQTGRDEINSVVISASGSIWMEGCVFEFRGFDVPALAVDETNGVSLELRADADSAGGADDADDATASTITLNNVQILTLGGRDITGVGGTGGDVTLAGPPVGTLGCPGDITLYDVDIFTTGGKGNVGPPGDGGDITIILGQDITAADDGDLRVANNCFFNLEGGGNLSTNLGGVAMGAGGDFLVNGFNDENVDDGADDGFDVIFNGRVYTDGGDYDGQGAAAIGGDAGTVTIGAGGDVSISASNSNVTIITNGGSAAIPGGFGAAGNGGNAGNITIQTGQDVNGPGAGEGNGVDDDGEFTLSTSSSLIATGGASDVGNGGAPGAGDGGLISIFNNTSMGNEEPAGTNVISTIAGNIVAEGGFVRAELNNSAGNVSFCGDSGGIEISQDADITVSGNLICRGGSVALDGVPDVGDLVSVVNGGAGPGLAAFGSGVFNGVFVDTTGDGQAQQLNGAPPQANSAYHGDLVVSGNIVVGGGGVIHSDQALGNDAGGDAGRLALVSDGDGTVAGNIAGLLVSGTLLNNGGPVYLGVPAAGLANPALPGLAGDTTIDADLSFTASNHDSAIDIQANAIVRADGGWFEFVGVNQLEVRAYGPGNATGSGVDIVSLDDNGDVDGNNGDVTIAGTLSARGDGNPGANFGVFVDASATGGIVTPGDDDSTSDLIFTGSIETAETTLDGSNARAVIRLGCDEGNLELRAGSQILGNRTIIQINHAESTDTQTLIAGMITNDHRSNAASGTDDGMITILSGAEETLSLTNEDILVTGQLTCNSGAITIAHTDPGNDGLVTNDGRVHIQGATLNADAVENPLLITNDGGNLVGGVVTLGGNLTDEVDYASGTISANGVETFQFQVIPPPPAAPPTPISLGAGAGGTVQITANGLLDSDGPITANGVDQTDGPGGNSTGGTVTLLTTGQQTGGAPAGGNLNSTSSINAIGGNRSNGGNVLFQVDLNATSPGAIMTVSSTINADQGDNTYVDPAGHALDHPALANTSVTFSALDVNDFIVFTGTASANGADNDAGGAGFAGNIGFNSNNTATVGPSVTLTNATLNATGGSSAAGLGGLGGRIGLSANVGAFLADAAIQGSSFTVSGGNGGSVGGDAGTIDFSNFPTVGAVFDFSPGAGNGGNSATLAGGSGTSNGSDGLFILDEGTAAISTLPLTADLSITGAGAGAGGGVVVILN